MPKNIENAAAAAAKKRAENRAAAINQYKNARQKASAPFGPQTPNGLPNPPKKGFRVSSFFGLGGSRRKQRKSQKQQKQRKSRKQRK